MAAASSANNQISMLYGRMSDYHAHIGNQLTYINKELHMAIHNTYRLLMEKTPNQEEKTRLALEGEQAKANMEESLFNAYNRLYIGLGQLLSIPKNRKTLHIIEPAFIQIKDKVKQLDRLLKRFRDTYKPRGRLNVNKLTLRNERNRSPRRNETRRGRSRNRNYSNLARTRSRSAIRDPSRPSRGSIRINPVAYVRETNAIGSRGNMTFSSDKIREMSHEAYKNIKNTFGSINEFKRSMSDANRIAREAAEITEEATQAAATASQASQAAATASATASQAARSPNRRNST